MNDKLMPCKTCRTHPIMGLSKAEAIGHEIQHVYFFLCQCRLINIPETYLIYDSNGADIELKRTSKEAIDIWNNINNDEEETE